MKRIILLRNQLSCVLLAKREVQIVDSALDYLNYDQYLNLEERAYMKNLRKYLNENISNKMPHFLEKKELPLDLIKELTKNFPGILGFGLKGYGCAGFSTWMAWAVAIELAICDLSVSTFCMIQGGELIMKTIHELGNESQRKKYLPKMNTLELIGSFCLTEAEHGSDASNLKTSAFEDVENKCIIINGSKRWIGSATIANFYVVWARNTKTKQVCGYIIDNPLECEGIEIKKINGKLSTRSMQNAEIIFKNVKIPLENKLEKASNFNDGLNKVLLGSRLGVAWGAVGASIGAYDRAIIYLSKRIQFGKPLTAFQLTQEKLAKMMGNIQASLFFCKRISELYALSKLSIGQVGLVKAWCTKLARETLAIARELLGGNGILEDNWIMNALMDIESLHTFEGTYDINNLVCGKELTGISAIK